jgi:parvulin-like peptidyl-prolyl isomerase
VIRRRLQLKMEGLTESGAQLVAPTDAVLEAHPAAHPDRFSQPPLLAFQQVLLADNPDAEAVSRALAGLNAGGSADGATRPTLLPAAMARPSTPQAIDGTFGTGFIDTIATLPPGAWSGPVETTFGRHLVRITERTAARLPALAEIRVAAKADWRTKATEDLRAARYAALASRYEIVVPVAAKVLAP